MHVLIVSQYFWPENFRINDLAQGLLERGHRVTVLTGMPNYPGGRLLPGYGYLPQREEHRGVRIIRVPLFPRGRGGSIRLILNYLSFALSAGLLGPLLCRERYDRIFVFEPSPVTVGIPAIILKMISGAPLLFWVQDLWPESLTATGAVRSRAIVAAVSRLVTFIYRRCDLILIQARAFLESVVRQGGAADKVRYFPNSAEDLYVASPAPATLPALPAGFRVLFAGNIGAAQDFETIIAAAELLKRYRDIHWVIVGDGRMRAWAESEAGRRNLSNVHFVGKYPPDAMPAFFARADALLVTLKNEPVFALTVPSKIQSYLACGRPIIAALGGEGAQIIEESGSGVCSPPGAPEALSRVVLQLYGMRREEREKMGENGRTYYRLNFDRELQLDRFEGWLKKCHTRG